MPLTEEHAKEGLSAAHILAVAAAARVNVKQPSQHDYGIDGWFEAVRVLSSGKLAPGPFPIPYQAKASENWVDHGKEISYPLDADAYNEIVTRPATAARKILVLLCLPHDKEKWHQINEDDVAPHTVLHHLCYWQTFTGAPIPNKATKTIWIPKDQVLTPEALNFLLVEEEVRLSP
jgi:hypothetical protein